MAPRKKSPEEITIEIANRAAADRFTSGTAAGDDIPFTYDPTNTTWPGNGWDHPRTARAGYDSSTGTLRVQFYSNGAVYDYHDVPASVARDFRMTTSPGTFINRVLNGYDYERIS